MTPNAYLAACLADTAAGYEVSRAQRSMDTKRIATAIESKRATTHTLMALQLADRRETSGASPMRVAAE